MSNYVDASSQTVWAGLAKRDNIRPDILLAAPDTHTPPAETIMDKKEQNTSHLQANQAHTMGSNTTLPLIERRKTRPGLIARISLPNPDLDDEVMPSPPPTKAVLSPLPAANKLHAGHTPLYAEALSPNMDQGAPPAEGVPAVAPEPDRAATPDQDRGLTGPLVLPTNPVDGAQDTIALEALDEELERIARDQERFSKLKDAPEPDLKASTDAEPGATEAMAEENDLPVSRKGSGDSRKSEAEVKVVDGIILKTPPLNFGMPIGQAPRRRSEHEE